MSIRLITRVWDETRFRGTTLLVLLALADHANEEGVCWPSTARIARRARCSRRQVFRILENLKQEGWVNVVGKTRPVKPGGTGTNIYQLRIPAGGMSPVSPADCCPFTGYVTDDIGGYDAHDTGGMSPVSPKPSENHQ